MASQKEIDQLRGLAGRVAQAAELPVMAERRRLWFKHNELHGERPMVLVYPEGAWRELLPESTLLCQDPLARRIERDLAMVLYQHEHINDDSVVEPCYTLHKCINGSSSQFLRLDWGLQAQRRQSGEANGAWGFIPVLKQQSDVDLIRMPEVCYDEEQTHKELDFASRALGNVLPVRLKGVAHFSFNMMQVFTGLRGLEQTYWDMSDQPEIVHAAMRRILEGYRNVITQCMEKRLFSLNNDDAYQGSGGNGYTSDLPSPGFDGGLVRPADMWASAESQEFAGVSPAMHEEFAMQYERDALQGFGLTSYGCCEDLTAKLPHVLRMPNLRRISVSPWADVAGCAEQISNRYLFSWKPQPAHLVGGFNEDFLRGYIQHTVDTADRKVLEIILKDTHTCENKPERFTQWTRIANSCVMN